MDEIIKVKNASYARYEELLLHRDNVRKDAEQIHMEYLRVFGDLMVEIFKRKIECIQKKKMIAYCQKFANQGKRIVSSDLQSFIEAQMEAYNKELHEMSDTVGKLKESKRVRPKDLKKLKEIYYSLAKMIHPDVRPDLMDDVMIKDLWQRIVIAYRHNDLQELEELNVLIRSYLEGKGLTEEDIDIPDIEEKILKIEEEIKEIITTNPYTYRILLEDPQAVLDKTQQLEDELESYRVYAEQLGEVLSQFEIEEMYA